MTQEELVLAFIAVMVVGIAVNIILTLKTHGSCGK